MLIQRRAAERRQAVVLRHPSEEIRFLLVLTKLYDLFQRRSRAMTERVAPLRWARSAMDASPATALVYPADVSLLKPRCRAAPVRGVRGMTQATRRRRVLIVEDEPALRLSYERAFRPRYDLVVRVAPAPRRMEQLEQHQPDVAVLDMRLPDTDGVELLRRIRVDRSPTSRSSSPPPT